MMLKKINIREREGGFTLIEMLIVLFIIGVLLLVIMPSLTDSGVQAQQKACDANKKMIGAQVEAYYLDHQRQYPKDVTQLVSKGYLKEIPMCPMQPTDEASYTINQQNGEVTCQYHK
ncbi:hypothetical protein CathTA2_1168 [Caldalkalibacillus thermarum TA2.A1]|uniref:Prepilin-type N-terminal cleavage/methylation domain-containing protein n=2 Tax=Caldalkalibacillus TaxID=379065 RepID=F5L5V5_CALTT|nr:hypothetical protein CathTA2_1168 [Caldalkalibacillus thermarum TA2.A1]QZT32686.1 prepilin-type N-terminal cleavage/methylation domain-containing protein [Caldalkalibacillus thermarum TA2.A1]GGK19321.1 hypothetical protein GCM10010965_10530 [Caldalkalibacillus thermarum]